MKTLDVFRHFPWYNYSSGEPELNEGTLNDALENTGSTDMNTALWNKVESSEYGELYTTMIKNGDEMSFINYIPDKKYTWISDLDDESIFEFHTESWEEVERLRYQINFNG